MGYLSDKTTALLIKKLFTDRQGWSWRGLGLGLGLAGEGGQGESPLTIQTGLTTLYLF